jgi:hypothetical protein
LIWEHVYNLKLLKGNGISFGDSIMSARPLKYLLGWLIAGTRGGVTRAELIKTIRDTPQNANQLATALKVDYKTVRYGGQFGIFGFGNLWIAILPDVFELVALSVLIYLSVKY